MTTTLPPHLKQAAEREIKELVKPMDRNDNVLVLSPSSFLRGAQFIYSHLLKTAPKMLKYGLVDISRGGEFWSEMRESISGNFYHMNDVDAQIAALQLEVQRLREQNDVAEGHAAIHNQKMHEADFELQKCETILRKYVDLLMANKSNDEIMSQLNSGAEGYSYFAEKEAGGK